ncbi:MAG: uroporphyrinogen decarboxylase family protein, partial [Syntrophomonadaceae bacterium]|nr:uroporphyrinogen decarboxylase family protein [Syntrophomonadaceae bacterium]
MMTVTGMDFVCRGDKGIEIPREIVQRRGFEFPAVHNSSSEMARLAREIKLYKQSNLCMLPFCSTVETEALGGIVNMGSESSGPRISRFTFDGMDQLKELKNMDFESGRIKEVLDAVELLRQSGEIVSLNVGGPFTVIASLIDPVVFYKAI